MLFAMSVHLWMLRSETVTAHTIALYPLWLLSCVRARETVKGWGYSSLGIALFPSFTAYLRDMQLQSLIRAMGHVTYNSSLAAHSILGPAAGNIIARTTVVTTVVNCCTYMPNHSGQVPGSGIQLVRVLGAEITCQPMALSCTCQ